MTTRLFFGRQLPGTVGESRRVVHVFKVPPGEEIPNQLTAYCGVVLGRDELELHGEVRGMPCERCLREAPTPAPEVSEGGSPDHEESAQANDD
ncbi:hypothetical protein [Amycolatopsis sp. NPDC049868]|uniref:hypothetical protein n=1 Tax=Amycolatopsis sp. NPDC049868 TaxID=3363934 RepID=UPI00379A26AE